jgi:hypothetical protein
MPAFSSRAGPGEDIARFLCHMRHHKKRLLKAFALFAPFVV